MNRHALNDDTDALMEKLLLTDHPILHQKGRSVREMLGSRSDGDDAIFIRWWAKPLLTVTISTANPNTTCTRRLVFLA